MAEFTLEASLNEAETSAAIAQAMAAGTITVAQAGTALAAWLKAMGGGETGGGAAEVHQDREGNGVLLVG